MSWRAKLFFAATAWLLTGALPAAAYPDRPVTIVVPFAAGGPSDIIARIIGEHWSRILGQQFVIENVTGAGGTVGAIRVMRAAPDGCQPSSTTTQRPVFSTDRMTVAVSIGRNVRRSMISALMFSFSSSSPALRA